MLIPCIDLQGGQAVQLVHGRRRELAVADVFGLLERFGHYRWLHVIDLDAAMRKGQNNALVRQLCIRARAEHSMKLRVGGGIRSVARAAQILSWGAEKIIVGSAAFHDGKIAHGFLRKLRARVGRKNVILALDTERGRIVVSGWRQRLKLRPADVIPQLEPYCSGFLCTFVDNEGTMKGTDLAWFCELRRVTKKPITAAGGIRSHKEVRALEKLGMHSAVGMALYLGKLSGS